MKKWTAVDLDDYRGVEPSGADMWSVVYLAADVDAREAQHIAIDRAQKAKIERLEKALAKYADHLHGCAYLAFVDDKCTCGHDAMLESFGLMERST